MQGGGKIIVWFFSWRVPLLCGIFNCYYNKKEGACQQHIDFARQRAKVQAERARFSKKHLFHVKQNGERRKNRFVKDKNIKIHQFFVDIGRARVLYCIRRPNYRSIALPCPPLGSVHA